MLVSHLASRNSDYRVANSAASTPTFKNQGVNMKNYPHHTMLPEHLQNMLKAAASSGRIETIDRAVKDLQRAAPNKFHDEKTVSERRFLNEPRQNVPNSGFEIPYPEGRTRS